MILARQAVIATTAGFPYWVQLLGGATADAASSIAFYDGKLTVGGYTATSKGAFLAVDLNGVVQWENSYTLGTAADFKGGAFDANNAYFVGEATVSNRRMVIMATDSDGNINWQRTLDTGTYADFATNCVVNGSGDLYVSGSQQDATFGLNLALAKYNSSGTIQWQRILRSANNDEGNSVAVDSSGNIYLVGYTNPSLPEAVIAKYDSAGTIQWQKRLYSASYQLRYQSIAIDGSDNIYCVGYSTENANQILIVKYDTSGTVGYQKALDGAGSDIGQSITTDSAGNVYIGGYTASDGAGSNDILLAQLDSSGNLQWQNTFGANLSELTFKNICIDDQDGLCLAGSSTSAGTGSTDMVIMRVPTDGTGDGTYSLDAVNYVYEASTLTLGTTSYTAGNASLTSTTGAMTDAAGTGTSAATTLTQYKAIIS